MDTTESGSMYARSQELMEPYWESRRQELQQQKQLGIIDPEIIDEQTGYIENETKSFNDWLAAKQKEEGNSSTILQAFQNQQTAPDVRGKQHKSIHSAPEAKLLKAHIPYQEGENDPSHPNYEAI